MPFHVGCQRQGTDISVRSGDNLGESRDDLGESGDDLGKSRDVRSGTLGGGHPSLLFIQNFEMAVIHSKTVYIKHMTCFLTSTIFVDAKKYLK